LLHILVPFSDSGFKLSGTGLKNTGHDLHSIVAEMESAANDIEAEIEQLRAQESELLLSVQQVVGNMSDLRYGRLANSNLGEQVQEGLASLQENCKGK
jgi:centromere-localized protein 2